MVGRCYRTADGEVRKIVAFDGGRVIYVIERNGVCPVWNRAMWVMKWKQEFALQADREVPCR